VRFSGDSRKAGLDLNIQTPPDTNSYVHLGFEFEREKQNVQDLSWSFYHLNFSLHFSIFASFADDTFGFFLHYWVRFASPEKEKDLPPATLELH
jgi:hypothetical protein